MRLIDERELIRRIAEIPDLRTLSTATVGKCIKECRTIDAEPVRHGSWYYGECSVCKEICIHYKPPYCPNCGAKMRNE